MNKSLLSRRYALALFEYADEKKEDKSLLQLLNVLVENWKEQPLLRNAMADPLLPDKTKYLLLQLACGDKENPVLNRFFSLLIHKRRGAFAGRIAKAYAAIWYKKHNILQGELITVKEPTPHLSESLIQLLEKIIPGKKVRLKMKEDESIVGGFILQLDSLRIDASIAAELRYLKNNLLKE